ncbi:hypothetical protein GCM10023185_39030 [Hymenobacter saemangeumensis]|uniref:Uncharacterized protein n=1 Tax=Hymenobacter saemangeumensis TaxID=1084522 RepID=A0ABP8IQM6_9BACT
MRNLLTLGTAALLLSASSCHRKCNDPKPQQPECYSGVVVGDACMDGILIEVDARHAIGRPASGYGNNVIAAVNFADLGNLNRVGQRVWFSYRNDPNQQYPNRACPTNTVPLPVPHLLLGNIASTACPGSAPR